MVAGGVLRGKKNAGAVRRPHGKDVLSIVVRDLAQSGAVGVDHINFDGTGHVVRESDSLAIGRIIGKPIAWIELGRRQICDLKRSLPSELMV